MFVFFSTWCARAELIVRVDGSCLLTGSLCARYNKLFDLEAVLLQETLERVGAGTAKGGEPLSLNDDDNVQDIAASLTASFGWAFPFPFSLFLPERIHSCGSKALSCQTTDY